MAETVRYNVILNDEVSAKLAAIEKRFQSLEAKIDGSNKAMSKMGKSLSLSNMLQGANLAFQLGQRVWGMAEAYIGSAGSMQANTRALKVASGSAVEMSTNQAFLNKLIDQASLPIKETSEGLKMWTAATMTSSIAGNTARQTFEDISIATASMGTDAETSKGIFLALSQMMSKGTVQAEELRGQLGERLPGAFALMAQSMGVTERQLGKMMENGEVISSEVLPKFARVLREKFGGGLAEANTGINATLTRLENLKTQGIIAMTPAINELMIKIEGLANGLFSLNWEPIGEAIAPMIAALDILGESMARLFGTSENGSFILKSLASAFHIFMQPIYTAISLVRILTESVVAMGEAIAFSIDGDFEGAKARIDSGNAKIAEVWAQNNKQATDVLKNIWSDTEKKDDPFLSMTTNKGGGDRMKSLLSGSLFDSPKLSTAGKDAELKKANANISGSAPRTTNITIGNIIGQNTNMIKRESEAQDITTFSKMLLQALQQEIVNVNLQV